LIKNLENRKEREDGHSRDVLCTEQTCRGIVATDDTLQEVGQDYVEESKHEIYTRCNQVQDP
jgi:hypothetical protein